MTDDGTIYRRQTVASLNVPLGLDSIVESYSTGILVGVSLGLGQAAKMGGRGPFPANPLPFPLLQPVPTGPLQQQIKPIELEKIRLLFDKMLR